MSRAKSNVHTSVKGLSMTSGTVKFYNGEKDVFVHATALERAGISGLREGQKVKFDTQSDPRSGKIAVGTIEMA